MDDIERNYQIVSWSGSGDAITTDTGLIFGPFRQPRGYPPVYESFQTKRSLTETTTLNFPEIAAQTAAELTVTITGAAVDDIAIASPYTSIEAGLIWSCYVSAANIVTVRLANPTASPIDPINADWRVAVHQFK